MRGRLVSAALALSLAARNFALVFLSPRITRAPTSFASLWRLYGEKKARVATTPERRWEVQAVGVVESPYSEKFGTPKQATISREEGGALEGKIRLFPGFEDCIDKLEGFDYIWVLTLMHLNKGYKTKIRPQPRANSVKQPPPEVGLFCSRAPHRPNPIALSCLKVTGVDVQNGVITVLGLDLLDDTPVLDIKPYVAAFDAFPEARAGWMDAITDDPLDGRTNGYQDIYSSRGMRMMRRNLRLKAEAEAGVGVGVGEAVPEATPEAAPEAASGAGAAAIQAGSCEATGSCRTTRAALKQELEQARQERAKEGRRPWGVEDQAKPSPGVKANYSPFRRAVGPTNRSHNQEK